MMWTSVLLILGVAFAVNGAFDRDAAKEKVFEYRVRSQQLHIDDLEEEIEKLEQEYEKLSDLPDKHHIDTLKARVKKLEKSDCRGKHTHECHGDPGHCVSDLHVCDGHKDCPNGGDEDDYTCSKKVIQAGRSYTGRATWESCREFEPHNIVVTIIGSNPVSYFGAFTFVRAVVTFEVDDAHHAKSFTGKGYWSYGSRLLALVPEENQTAEFAVSCKFNLGDSDTADCKVLERVSLSVCARFRAATI